MVEFHTKRNGCFDRKFRGCASLKRRPFGQNDLSPIAARQVQAAMNFRSSFDHWETCAVAREFATPKACHSGTRSIAHPHSQPITGKEGASEWSPQRTSKLKCFLLPTVGWRYEEKQGGGRRKLCSGLLGSQALRDAGRWSRAYTLEIRQHRQCWE